MTPRCSCCCRRCQVQAGTKQEQAEAHTPGVAKKPALEDASARRPAHQPQPQAPQQAPTPGGGGALPIKTPSPGSAEPRVRLQPYTPPAGSSKPDAGLHKIAALHPYSDQWSIKAKVTRKYPVRTVKGDSKVMSLELVDDQGTPIQATMWRQAVDRFADGIGEERVYVFSRFTVKPSNRAYSTVKNDYEVHLDNRYVCANIGLLQVYVQVYVHVIVVRMVT